MTRDDVIDVLSIVAAATRRTIGETDVLVWQGVIGDLDRKACMDAVTEHLRNRPGVWLEPGHIRQAVKAKRRDELDREPDSAREARQAILDARFKDRVEELAEAKALTEKYTRRDPAKPNPLTVTCPWCDAGIGFPCTTPRVEGKPSGGYHPSRVERATR